MVTPPPLKNGKIHGRNRPSKVGNVKKFFSRIFWPEKVTPKVFHLIPIPTVKIKNGPILLESVWSVE